MKNWISLLLLSFFYINNLQAQTFDVKHYEINLKVPNTYSTYIEAFTVLDIKILQDDISEISLMLLDLNVDSILILSEIQSFTHNDTLIYIQLDKTYQSNEELTISVYYHGDARTDDDGWGGYFSVGGYVYNLGVSMSANPHNYGRAWYPCVDNFTDKATYNFNITCQEQYTAVCGGTLVDEINNGDNTKTYSWILNRQTPTYLTSVAVGKYAVYRDTFDAILGRIPVAIYARNEEINNVPASFLHLKDIFNIYESKFGAYRWGRVGYVGVPFNGGAMEHAENITYPNSAIDGTLNNETLYGHELSHSWFGNLSTCSTAEDMWLNEGWASYCEAILTENLYGKEAFKTYNRVRHYKNLQKLHFEEGGFLAIYGIPTELTYSSHVYDKGADVVHSLRSFLGDDVFFETITHFLDDYQFQAVSSYQLRDYLTANTDYDLSGFFDSWVFSGGWMHFAVDSFQTVPNGDQFDVQVFMRQKLKGKSTFGNNNRVPIQFLSSDFKKIDTTITFSGETGTQMFTIPFQPYSVLCDMEESVSDATTDKYMVIKNTGDQVYSRSFFKTNILAVQDSVLLRVEHNWVAPDPFKTEIEGLSIHPERYWKIDGIFNDNFKANGQFYYSRSESMHLDDRFLTEKIDSVVVLYRPSSKTDWQIIPHTINGSNTGGYLVIDQLKRGEYAFAIWDHRENINYHPIQNQSIKIYPNPADSFITLSNLPKKDLQYQIINANGQVMKQANTKQTETLQISIQDLSKGVYILTINRENLKFVKE